MFVFDDFVVFDVKNMGVLLCLVDIQMFILVLCGVLFEMVEKMFGCLLVCVVEIICDEMVESVFVKCVEVEVV